MKVIQAQSSVWQAVKEDPSVFTDFGMIASPVLHMKHNPSLGKYILLFSGYFSSKTDPATSYCHIKTEKDDECCPKTDAFRSTSWSWDSTQACDWAWPGVCRELLVEAASDGEHLVIPEVPKECTWKDMTIKRKKECSYKPTPWRNCCRKIISDLIICTWLDENVLKKFYISVVESQAANMNILITVDSYI